VIEQNCPYQDLDGVDKTAYHLITNDGVATVATLRIYIDNNNVVHIGRVVVAQTHRKTRLGRLIMSKAIDWSKNNYSEREIHISAQQYLDDFYTNLGFKSTGKKYLEDGIPHQEMILL
jgi:ElaA protein